MSGQTPYFPYRAFKNRSYFAEFGKLPDKMRRWEVLTQMALRSTREQFSEDQRKEPRASTCIMAEARLCDSVWRFFGGGQVVFHLAQPLRDAFLLSELGEARVSDLKFPFNNLYVHLGADLGLTFNDGAAVLEGAFLEHLDSGELVMCLVGGLVDEPAHWGERGMESFGFHFAVEDANRPLLEAISERLEHQAKDPNTMPDFSDWSGFTPEQKKDVQEHWARHAEGRELQARNSAVVLSCVKLVANALLYLAQYPEDVEEAWQDGSPPAFQEKYARSDGKIRERVLSKARSAGFTLIRKVGKLFEKVETLNGTTGDSPSPHLRRAHWRRQPHGPQGSLRKLMWIRAARVLGGATRERPYLMSE